MNSRRAEMPKHTAGWERTLWLWIVCATIATTLAQPAGALSATRNQLRVPENYATIQAAVNAAVNAGGVGDTITIAPGTYTENVVINAKHDLFINSRSANGATIVQPFESTKPVFAVDASTLITLYRLKIRGSTQSEDGTVKVHGGSNVTIQRCAVGNRTQPNKLFGILSRDSGGLTVSDNTVEFGRYGIEAGHINVLALLNNTVRNFWDTGIRITDSTGGRLADNRVSLSGVGLHISNGATFKVERNTLFDNVRNLHLYGGIFLGSLDMDTTNTVDGRPVYVIKNAGNFSVPLDAGYVALSNCRNVTVGNLFITRGEPGVWLSECFDCTISQVKLNRARVFVEYGSGNKIQGCTMTDSLGIFVHESDEATIAGNTGGSIGASEIHGGTISGNTSSGIGVSESTSLKISGNTLKDGAEGISARDSSELAISGNTILRSSRWGMELDSVNDSTVSGNVLGDNHNGLSVSRGCRNSVFTGNTISGGAVNLDLAQDVQFDSITIDDTNTIEGKPVRFLKNQTGVTVPADTGYLALIGCSAITAENLTLMKNGQGVVLVDTSDSTLRNLKLEKNTSGLVMLGGSGNLVDQCSISQNHFQGLGMFSSLLSDPSNNTISKNKFLSNGDQQVYSQALYLYDSAGGNVFYENSFIANRFNVRNSYSYQGEDAFSSPGPISYTYRGKQYLSRLGNYYAGYGGADADLNGIGDTPQDLGTVDDIYPLMWDPQPKRFVSIIAPNGWEMWTQGTQNTITWSSGRLGNANIRVDLYKSQDLFRNIALAAPNTGTLAWTIPYSVPAGNDYQIRLSAGSTTALSDARFTIVSGLSLTAPNGGERWMPGTAQTISWNYSGTPGGTVKIELLARTTVAKVLATSAPVGTNGQGSFLWRIPLETEPGKAYRIRLRSNKYPGAADASDSFFQIIGR